MSCAQNGAALGIQFAVLREVEKQVIIYEAEPAEPIGPDLDAHDKWLNEEMDMEDAKKNDEGDREGEDVALKDVSTSVAPVDVADVAQPSATSDPAVVESSSCIPAPLGTSADSAPAQKSAELPVNASNGLTPKVIKIIKKSEIELLCSQHNPVRIMITFSLFLGSSHVIVFYSLYRHKRKRRRWIKSKLISWHFRRWHESN